MLIYNITRASFLDNVVDSKKLGIKLKKKRYLKASLKINLFVALSLFFQSKLFEGLEEDSGLSPGTFVPRKNIKKLVIKSKSVTEVPVSYTHLTLPTKLEV